MNCVCDDLLTDGCILTVAAEQGVKLAAEDLCMLPLIAVPAQDFVVAVALLDCCSAEACIILGSSINFRLIGFLRGGMPDEVFLMFL